MKLQMFKVWLVISICQVAALAMPMPMPAPATDAIMQQARSEHWQLPNVDVQAVLPLFDAFPPRVGHAILQEVWEENAYRKQLPMSWDTQSRVFDAGNVSLAIQASTLRPDHATVHLSIKPYVTRFLPLLQQRRDQIKPLWQTQASLDADTDWSLMIPVNEPGVYHLQMVLTDADGTGLAQRGCYFAVRYNSPFVGTAITGFTSPQNRPLLTQYYLLKVPKEGELPPDPLQDFKVIKERGYDGVHVVIHWDDVEIFPGGYDFSELDQAIEAASQNHMAIGIFVMYQVHRIPFWLWADHMVDQDGKLTTAQGSRFKLVPAISSQVCRQSYVALIQKIIQRYDGHPNVSGYHLSTRNVEWAYPGVERRKQCFDYSEPARQAFNAYVSQQGLSLDLPVAVDGQLQLPRPTFDKPDASLPWRAMVDSKLNELRSNAQLVGGSARSLTQKDLIFYNFGGFGPVDNLLPILREYDMAGGICSPNVFYGPMINDLYRHAGLKIYQEPSHLGGQAPDAFFFHLLHAGRVIHEVGGIIHFPDRSKTLALQKRFDHYLPLLNLLDHEHPQTQMAVWFSFDSLMDTSKAFDVNSWWWNRIKPLTRGLAYAGLPVSYVSDYSQADLKAYQAVMVIDAHLLRQDAVERLAEYVRQGGTLILFPGTATYQVGLQTHDSLEKALGIPMLKMNHANAGQQFKWSGRNIVLKDVADVLRSAPWQRAGLDEDDDIASLAQVKQGRVLMFHGKLPVLEEDWQSNEPGLQNVAFVQSLMRYCELRPALSPTQQQPVRSYVFTLNGKKHIALLNDDSKNTCLATFDESASDLRIWRDVLNGQEYIFSNGQMQVSIPPLELRVFRESKP